MYLTQYLDKEERGITGLTLYIFCGTYDYTNSLNSYNNSNENLIYPLLRKKNKQIKYFIVGGWGVEKRHHITWKTALLYHNISKSM